MKMPICILPMIAFFMILSLFPLLAGAQDDVKYLGDICYSLDEDKILGKPPAGVRIGVMSFGADYFVLSGVEAGFIPIHGTALIVQNTIIISLYSTYVSPALVPTDSKVSSFSAIHMVVDAQTLKGTHTTMIVQTTPEPLSITTHRGSVSLFLCN